MARCQLPCDCLYNRVATDQLFCRGKVFPYSLPSVGPGADPGVQAVSPQVTWSESCHRPDSRLPLLSARPAGYLRSFHQMALPVNGSKRLIPALLLIYRPRKDKRLSWPSWLTCSGWFTHISGHPLAAGRAQDRVSSPVRDRRSTTVLRHQPEVHGNLTNFEWHKDYTELSKNYKSHQTMNNRASF